MHKIIPGKLYQHLDFGQTNLYEETSFKHIKNLYEDDIVLVIDKVKVNWSTFESAVKVKVLTTDGTIGVIFYYFYRWKKL